jgi:DNA-directed RNA polymerase specialized sigma24 family protein
MELDRFRELLKRSSLGTPAAQAHRASVPTGMIEQIVSRAEQLERSQSFERGSFERGTYIRTIAASADAYECVELARTALSTVLFSGSGPLGAPGAGKSATLRLMPVQMHEAEEHSRRAIVNIKLWSFRGYVHQRRPRMLLDRLELERRELERLAMAAADALPERRRGVSRRLPAIARWAGWLLGRDYQAVRALTDMDLRGAQFTFGDFCQRTVPPLERAARLLIDDHNLEDECVNEVVAAALAQASTRWRWLAEHPAPTTWTVRIALQALDPAIAASRESHITWSIDHLGQELWQPIVESVWKMPTHEREVIGLWATCRFEPNQIAHVLDLPERRVRQVKDRALRQLQAADPRCQ